MTPQQEVRRWKREIELAEKREKEWRETGKKIYSRYRGKDKKKNSFNILWANTEVLRPALYNSTPKPDVRRRFRDQDPLGKAVGEVLERGLTYTVDVNDLSGAVKYDVLDALLPGRGLSRIRYVPSFREGTMEAGTEQGENDEVEYEQVLAEHVDWQDFLHGYGRVWQEVEWVGFHCQLNKKDVTKQFGAEVAQAIKFDELKDEGENNKADQDSSELDKVSDFWEIWDKTKKRVCFYNKHHVNALIYPLDNPNGDPPLEFEGFFPIPEPLKVVEDSSSLLPIPMWTLYQEQAEELDRLSLRINRIVNALKIRGVYDSTLSEISQLMEGEDNALLPLQNASSFKNAGGLEKAIWWMPVEQAARVLAQLYEAREACKQIIFEITGLSDIVRGQSNPNETLGAQKIKANYSSMRLQRMQREVQRYVRDLIRMMGEVISEKFPAETLMQMTGLHLPDPMQKMQLQQQAAMLQQQGQPIPQDMQAGLQVPTWDEVLKVLRSDELRQFRVDVETDSTVQESLDSDMQGLQEVLTGVTQLIQGFGPAVQAGAVKVDAVKQLVLAVVRRARMGIAVEDALEQGMQEPHQQGDPNAAKMQAEQAAQQAQLAHEQQTEQFKAQVTQATEAARVQADQSIEQARLQAAAQLEQLRAQSTAQLEESRMQLQAHLDEQKRLHEAALEQQRMAHEAAIEAGKIEFERWKIERQEATKIEIAELGAQTTLSGQQATAAQLAAEGKTPEFAKSVNENFTKLHGRIDEVARLATAKRVLIRDKAGRPVASQIEGM